MRDHAAGQRLTPPSPQTVTEKQKILWEMWTAGAPVKDIAGALGVSESVVYSLRHQYGLPKRERIYSFEDDPTPEQIAERARECRERHYAMRRSETDNATNSKLWKQQDVKKRRYRSRSSSA